MSHVYHRNLFTKLLLQSSYTKYYRWWLFPSFILDAFTLTGIDKPVFVQKDNKTFKTKQENKGWKTYPYQWVTIVYGLMPCRIFLCMENFIFANENLYQKSISNLHVVSTLAATLDDPGSHPSLDSYLVFFFDTSFSHL